MSGGGWLGKFRRAISAMKNQALKVIKTTATAISGAFTVVKNQAPKIVKVTAAAVKTGFNTVHKFAHEHPYWTGAIAVVLIGAGVCLVAPHAVLGALGWKTIGPAAGSFAALSQSIFWGDSTGGLFSALQSFTMSGAAVATKSIIAGCVSIIVGTGLFGMAAKEWWGKCK